MRPAEIILRVGCVLVGWILAYVHGLVLAVLPRVDCSQGAEPWRAALLLAVPAAAVPFLLPMGGLVRDTVRWLALPYLALVLLAVRAVVPTLRSATLDGAALCPAETAAAHLALPPWQRAWAPLQLGLLAVLAVSALHYAWPRGREEPR